LLVSAIVLWWWRWCCFFHFPIWFKTKIVPVQLGDVPDMHGSNATKLTCFSNNLCKVSIFAYSTTTMDSIWIALLLQVIY
jgi:hypothetical protein